MEREHHHRLLNVMRKKWEEWETVRGQYREISEQNESVGIQEIMGLLDE